MCITCHDLAGGGAVAVDELYRCLSTDFETKVAGFVYGKSVLTKLINNVPNMTVMDTRRKWDYFTRLPKFLRVTRSDVILCVKARFPALFPALIARFFWGAKVVLLVDDDELALTEPGRKQSWRAKLQDIDGYLFTRIADKLKRFVDLTICESRTLQHMHGGVIVPLPRALPQFDPCRFDRAADKRKFGFSENEFTIGFIGAPRAHKGLDTLVEALALTKSAGVRLVIAPPSHYEIEPDLAKLADDHQNVRLITGVPWEDVPSLLSACDMVAIPQKETAAARSQVPAKLIEAMAMGKPIVATDLSDMGLYLEDAGLVIQPEDSTALAAAIDELCQDPQRAARLGEGARAYFLRHFTHETAGVQLRRVLKNFLASQAETP